jgi:nanoRNase/pAp phosphatase (c-di-AMP/oligoRNAs hydrolase)
VSPAEMLRFNRLITVDAQPTVLGDLSGAPAGLRLATIDHHPAESGYDADFLDIRPTYGATATIMTEYLRTDARLRIGAPLASALLHGIRTDTDGLARGVTAEDVDAYAFLQEHADPVLLRRLERPSYPLESARAYGAALAGLVRDNDTVVAYAGTLDSDRQHVLADLADFCLGIQGVTWAVAAAIINEDLVLGLRHHGPGPGAGDLARVIAAEGGKGGGHAAMGRVSVPQSMAAEWLGSDDDPARTLLEQVRGRIESLEG